MIHEGFGGSERDPGALHFQLEPKPPMFQHPQTCSGMTPTSTRSHGHMHTSYRANVGMYLFGLSLTSIHQPKDGHAAHTT